MKKLLIFLLAVCMLLPVCALTSCRQDIQNAWNKSESSGSAADMLQLRLKPANGYIPSSDELRTAESVVEHIFGLQSEHSVIADTENNEIVVSYSEKEPNEDIENRKAVFTGKGGAVTFRNGEKVLLDGGAVDHAQAAYYQGNENSPELSYCVQIFFTPDGAKAFEKLTEEYIGGKIGIWVGDELISKAAVHAPISDGVAQIAGEFTAQQVQQLSDSINRGLIPFSLEIVD